MARREKLTVEQQTYVVQALACFDAPGVVAASMKKDFGIVISLQSAESYDPTKRAGAKLAKRWRALFEETRKAFLEDTANIAISHRAVRLRALQRMAEKAETQGNMALSAQLLEQAAKEQGNAFTNRREITGKNGGAFQAEVTQKLDASNFSDDELEIMIRAAQRRESGATSG